MKFDVLTLFPEMFTTIKESIIGRAIKNDLIQLNITNIRDFSKDKHKHVDDTPYGGGAGMVINPTVVYDSYTSIKNRENAHVIYLSPKGKKLDQAKVLELAQKEHLILLCGHYEGIDERVLNKIVDEEISIGDYVLTGGELPAMCLIDAVARYVPNVLNGESVKEETFSNNLLEYPQYTRPIEFEGEKVPEVLVSGNHQEIDKWRYNQSLIETYTKRPELLSKDQKEQAEKLIAQK